jgi:hypothetical protein
MERIYLNRIDGQRRIHVEIHENEVSDLLDDLKADPEHFASTRLFLGILRVAEEIFLPAVSETRRNRDAARTASGQQPETAEATGQADTAPSACSYCNHTWTDHGEEVCGKASHRLSDGLLLTSVCRCTKKATAPAVGQPAEAQATDEAHPADVTFAIEKRGDTDWLMASSHYDEADREKALSRLARRREQYPDTEFRLVRETTTWTVEDETR